MFGSLITRGLLLIFGYIYPAYECYKTVELNKPDLQQLRFWCQYWILVAGLTVCERIGDMFIGWVPMYGEAKLAFFIYLWFPKTKGTTYVYDSFFRPYVAKHEPEIDRNLLELRTRAGDMVLLYWQRTASYGSTRIFDILQYIASQSTPSRPAQQQQTVPKVPNPAPPPNPGAPAPPQLQNGQPSIPGSSTSTSEQQKGLTEQPMEEDSKTAPAPAAPALLKTTPTVSLVETSKTSNSTEENTMQQIDTLPSTSNSNVQSQPEDIVLEETGRVVVTRARARRTRAPANR